MQKNIIIIIIFFKKGVEGKGAQHISLCALNQVNILRDLRH